jgi:hypothetical protein
MDGEIEKRQEMKSQVFPDELGWITTEGKFAQGRCRISAPLRDD